MGVTDEEFDQEILQEFLTETSELLEKLDRELVELESTESEELLSSVFRSFHTIKGSAGFLGFNDIEFLTHEAENLLALIRSGSAPLTPRAISALLGCADTTGMLIHAVSNNSNAPDIESTIVALKSAKQNYGSGDTHTSAPKSTDGLTASEASPRSDGELETIHGEFDSVRVDVEVLDDLMTAVSELVLARNQLRNELGEANSSAQATLGRLSSLTSDLQASITKTRMQPISNLFSKYPRIVRDLASSLGKVVELHVKGASTELDRALIDAFRDPLTHLVRNAIDHGIETPETRASNGKEPQGHLLLTARHESGHVVVSIQDDGAGLNHQRILEKATQLGLVTPDTQMSDKALTDLIFAPGFSTSDTVSNLSGRGVGMDVVKTQIELIGGTVSIDSTPGIGTTVTATLPLTLAIMPSLIVQCSGQRYAIPQSAVEELVLARHEQWETIAGTPVLRLRETLLPLVFLSRILATEPSTNSRVVVVRDGGLRYGIVVDDSPGTEEIVVKPLDTLIATVPAYSGSTILPDGSVALVLDIGGIASLSGVTPIMTTEDSTEDNGKEETLPVVYATVGNQLSAFLLRDVERLEEFSATSVQKAGGAPVVRYRDGLLELTELAPGSLTSSGVVHTIVIRDSKRELGVRGIVVDQIIDIGQAEPLKTHPSAVLMGETVADLVNIRDLREKA